MRRIITVVVVFGVVAIGGGCATLQPKGPVDIVAEGCKAEFGDLLQNRHARRRPYARLSLCV